MALSPDDRPSLFSRLGGLLRYANLRWRLLERVARAFGALAQRFFPVFQRGNTVYVLRCSDVRSVLARPDDFSVAIFGLRMIDTIGLTFLGMNPSPQYTRESGAMRAALQVPDARPGASSPSLGPDQLGRLTWVRRFGAGLASQRVNEALKTKGEVDVVSDLADVVPLHFAREFFGTPEPDPHHPEILHCMKLASYYVFSPAASDWAVPAHRAGNRMRDYFGVLVAERHAAIREGRETPDDVLGRLIAAQDGPGGLDDDAIARSLGFISGAMIPTSWLFIEAVDRLMGLPRRQRERLHRLAVEGDVAGVRAYVVEAARFFPFPFFILRYAERDTEIAGRPIAHGTTVNLVIGAATTDPRAMKRPGRFIPGRPESEYMLFGHETHYCQGADIAEELMTQMAMSLFSRENLRRAPGLRGFIDYGPKGGPLPNGYYPRTFILKADG